MTATTADTTGFQVMPSLTPEEYRALEQSIREHGVQVPITVAPDGRIVDGHHRNEIAEALHLHCPRVAATGDDTELRTLAFELNNHRRQQGREHRRGQVRKSLRSDPQLSNRQHAARTGVHHETVQAIRVDMESTGEIRQSAERVSADGRTRPAEQVRAPKPFVNTETGEVSDDYVTDQADLDNLTDDTTGEEVTAPDEAPATADDSVGEPSPEVERTPTAALPPVAGGQQRREPAKPRRLPLTDSVRNASMAAETKLTTLRDLTRDDRWSQNAEKVAPWLRNDLLRIQSLLNQAFEALPEITEEST